MSGEIYIDANSPTALLGACLDHVQNYPGITEAQRVIELAMLRKRIKEAFPREVRYALVRMGARFPRAMASEPVETSFGSLMSPDADYAPLPGFDKEHDHILIEQHREKLNALLKSTRE